MLLGCHQARHQSRGVRCSYPRLMGTSNLPVRPVLKQRTRARHREESRLRIISVGRWFKIEREILNRAQTALSVKNKADRLDRVRTENFCSAVAPLGCEKTRQNMMFARHVSD